MESSSLLDAVSANRKLALVSIQQKINSYIEQERKEGTNGSFYGQVILSLIQNELNTR